MMILLITLLRFLLLLLSAEGAGGGGSNVSKLLMVVACVLFGVSVFAYRPAPTPNVWYGRLFAGAFFAWTLAIVVQMFALA